jgi:hypothetical protein
VVLFESHVDVFEQSAGEFEPKSGFTAANSEIREATSEAQLVALRAYDKGGGEGLRKRCSRDHAVAFSEFVAVAV